jgi:hypothetical protein
MTILFKEVKDLLCVREESDPHQTETGEIVGLTFSDHRMSSARSAMTHNVPAVADARESQRAGVPKGEPPQAAKRQPSC